MVAIFGGRAFPAGESAAKIVPATKARKQRIERFITFSVNSASVSLRRRLLLFVHPLHHLLLQHLRLVVVALELRRRFEGSGVGFREFYVFEQRNDVIAALGRLDLDGKLFYIGRAPQRELVRFALVV